MVLCSHVISTRLVLRGDLSSYEITPDGLKVSTVGAPVGLVVSGAPRVVTAKPI